MNARFFIPNTIHESINSPNHVRLWKVNDKHPQRHEYANRCELHAFGDGSDDQRGSNNREHQLIHGEYVLRNPGRIIRVRRGIDTFEKSKAKAPKDLSAVMKDQAVSTNIPKDGYKPCDEEALRHDGKDVL